MIGIELTDRQKLILALTIQEYTRTAQPVASNRLLKKYGLEMSSATVRNEMAALAEMGYLRQPHTSAGRIPTEEGFRFFVGQLMGQTELPATTRQTIAHQFYQTRQDSDEWMRLAASVLAKQSHAASLVTAPQHLHARFKHLELISIRGRQILMVLVMESGEVRQQMLDLAEPVSQDTLSATANEITSLCARKNRSGIAGLPGQQDALKDDILKLVRDLMVTGEETITGEVYRDGLLNVLTEPEFSESDSARRALRVLEERPFLENLLTQTVLNSDIGVVQVIIGGEGNWQELSECSMVLARYGIHGTASGTLGVLGPIRMRYGRTISTVRFVAGLLSEMVLESHQPAAEDRGDGRRRFKGWVWLNRTHPLNRPTSEFSERSEEGTIMEDEKESTITPEPRDRDPEDDTPRAQNGDGLVDAEGEPIIGLAVSEYDRLHEELETARREAEKNLDNFQRALADYSNLRRRTEQEREQMHGELLGRILNPFLEVLDDLDLAVRNRPTEGTEKSWGEGIELVYRKLLGRLESLGVSHMDVDDQAFDPHFHEAITHEESEEFDSGQVIAVVKPGYMIGDRVLRPAMVRVAA
jgi:heat-inducible transcriptional repressor